MTQLSQGELKPVDDRFKVLGHSDLWGGGLNADVWAHNNYAYVGVWSGTCPATGVKVVDYHNLGHPMLVSRLRNDAGTSAEDVVVRHVTTKTFDGDLAVTGIQVCGEVDEPVVSVGCHEVDLVQRADGAVLAGCSNVFAEQINGTDEVVLVDATDPSAPSTAGGWSIGADLGVEPDSTRQNIGASQPRSTTVFVSLTVE